MTLELLNLGLVTVGPFVAIGGLWAVARWSVYKHADEQTVSRLGQWQVRAAEREWAARRERARFQLGREEVPR